MKKAIVMALGATLTIVALSGRIAGPYTLVVNAGQNPVTAATAQCHEQLAGLAIVLTSAREDGDVEVFFRCERR